MESLSNNELIKQIKRYQYNIQQVDPPENDTQRVLHYIRKLSKLPIKLEELEKTGVGKTINALRKRQGSIGEEATLLVAKWKSIAKRQVQEEESAAQQRKRSSDSHSDYESPGSDLKSSVSKESKKIRVEVQKQPEKPVKELKLKSSKHTSDRLSKESLVKKRKHSSDDEEKVAKKNKHIKLEPEPASEEENYSEPETKVKQVTPSKPVKSEDKHHDRERKKRKEKDKQESDKSHKKEQHDKKHHKSNKHKDDKSHHRHHSKSSHPEKTNRDVSKSDVDKHRNDKKSDSKNRRDSEKPTSSSKKDSKSNGKHYSSDEAVTSTRNDLDSDDSDTYHDFSVKTENTLADDDFGAALLSISQTTSPVKRKSTPSKYSSIHSSPATNSPPNSGSDFDTISSSVKLEPLDDIELELKEDSYSSNNDNSRERAAYRLKNISDDVAMNSMYTTKNQRTKVFSGFKSKFINAKFPTLFELCVRVLQDNFDALEYTGGVPYDVLKPILEKVTVEQLYAFENYNPYLIGETDELWECHVKRHFRSAKRLENETWRDVYLRCVEEREEKLQSLTENISQSIANSTPVRKTKLAYFDSIVKPPRNVARSQAKHGTGQVTGKRSPKGPQPSQAAVLSVKDRLARESMAAPVALSAPSKNLLTKKKKAPLMQKTLQLLKGMKR